MNQSALHPAGPQAQELSRLIWVFTGICTVIWLLVLLVLAVALLRRRAEGSERPEPRRDRRAGTIVGGAVAATVLVVAGLTVFSFTTTRALHAGGAEPLLIQVRGYQWWWEVTYPGAAPDQAFRTANEIHIPVGRPVRVELSAEDVIHSFWVPSLGGKQDLIPGRGNVLLFTADRPGTFRGQCAEFCGLQHAHMAMLVVAEPPDAFEAWRHRQRAPAAAPAEQERQAGQRVMEAAACAACHTVRGTRAAGTLGPDLTHVGSRGAIAAGMLPTTTGSLAAWIADPQTVKPGNNMPMVPLSADELRAVSAYLAGLE